MKAFPRSLMAAAPVAALLLAPAVANAHPNNDSDVTVSSYSSTVQVDIFNYHDFAIDCQTSVDGGSLLFLTAPAQGTASTWHGGTPAGTHTVSWSCSSDNGATPHSSGSKTVTVEDSSSGSSNGENNGENNGTNNNNDNKADLCDIDFFGGFEKIGMCPKN